MTLLAWDSRWTLRFCPFLTFLLANALYQILSTEPMTSVLGLRSHGVKEPGQTHCPESSFVLPSRRGTNTNTLYIFSQYVRKFHPTCYWLFPDFLWHTFFFCLEDSWDKEISDNFRWPRCSHSGETSGNAPCSNPAASPSCPSSWEEGCAPLAHWASGVSSHHTVRVGMCCRDSPLFPRSGQGEQEPACFHSASHCVPFGVRI